MAMNPLPPQAYTKETLQKAYQWLLTQNASIKEMASNQEILVSLYLKAQRNGDAALEAPSIQNFKQELKSLANMMGDFQGPQAQQPATGVAANYTNGSPAHHSHQTTGSSPSVNYANASTASKASPGSTTHSAAPVIKNNFIAASANSAGLNDLDQHSLQLIQEAKTILNLSSDTEALRALISMGQRQLKKITS